MKNFIKSGGYNPIPEGYGSIIKSRGKEFFSKNSTNIRLYLVIVLVLFFISWFIYYLVVNSTRQLRKQINCGGCSRFYKDGKEGSSPNMIQHNKINQIPSGNSSTWCFWLNINNWYYKYDSWKSILLKGSLIKPENDLSWNSVGQQCPGIWMTPNQNNIRAVFTTKRLDKDNQIKDYLEYCQINDIPIGKWCHLGVVVVNKTVAIYLNGRLVRTCVLKGKPSFNNGPLQVSYSGGFNGNLRNFRYIGKKLGPQYMRQLYEIGPEEKGKYFWDRYDLDLPKIDFEDVTITLPKVNISDCN